MANDESDPKIVARLAKLPPFDDEVPAETPVEEPKQEETPAEETQPAPEVPEEAPVETKQEEITEDETKKRTTEQFEKLKAHNAELKKQLDEQKAPKVPTKNALDALYPEVQQPMITNQVPTTQQYPNLATKEIKDAFAGLTDDQGYVDTGLLKETLVELDRRAKEAEARAKQAEDNVAKITRKQDDFERNDKMREVHKVYPKLDPNNVTTDDPDRQFDSRFYEQFQKEIMYQWSTAGQADPMVVAEKAFDIIYGSTMKKAEKEKVEQAELAKKNINATTAKPASQREVYKDQDELIMATRSDKPGALAERLKRAGQ